MVDGKEVANYLLNHCYIIGTFEAHRDKYYYAINHMEELRKIFLPLGYTPVLYPSPLKVVALINEMEGTQARLNKYESILLLICRLLYIQKRESLSTDGDQVLVTVEDIQQEYQKMNLPQKLDARKLEAVFSVLRAYNLASPLDKLNDLSAKIEIFPSVILAMPDNILKASAEETRKLLVQYQRGEEQST